jgi:hypothetical protein
MVIPKIASLDARYSAYNEEQLAVIDGAKKGSFKAWDHVCYLPRSIVVPLSPVPRGSHEPTTKKKTQYFRRERGLALPL